MNYDKGFFDSPEFRELLKKYEQATSMGMHPYWGVYDLVDLMSYYLFIEKEESAETVLKEAQHLHPTAPETIKMEVKLLLYKGEAQKAMEKFSSIGYIDDDESRIIKAEIFIALKDFKNARNIALEILRKAQPEQDNIYEALEILLDCGFAVEALAICESVLKELPEKKSLLEVKAECLIEMQRINEAAEIYNKLLDDEPYSTFYWEQLGHIYYMVKKYGKALECFEYESTINDDIEYARMMQAYCYYFMHDYTKAKELFDSLSDKYPRSVLPLFYMALIYSHEGNNAKAIDTFNRIIEVAQEGTIEAMLARLNKAMLLDTEGKITLTDGAISMAIMMHPDNMKQLVLRGTHLYELRDKENLTFDDMNTLESKEWTQEEALLCLGQHLVEHGHLKAALRVLLYTREFAYDPSEIDAYVAYILFNTDKKDSMEQAVEGALEGKSWTLFRLFGLPYNANITAKGFISLVEKSNGSRI